MKPIISLRQSGLGFLQWETFSFSPFALGIPTGWRISSGTLPTGVTLDDETGLITGAAQLPGVYNFGLQAENSDGWSSEVPFTIAIEASVADPAANVIDLILDLGTREVFAGPTPAETRDAGETPANLSADDAKRFAALGAPLAQAKRGDQLLFRVQVKRGGVAASITLSELKLALKQFEPDSVLVTSSAFHSLGSGVFLVYIELVDEKLTAALSEYEGDFGTIFPGICELTWLAANGLSGTIGGASLRGSSRNFRIDLVRDVTE